MENAQTAGAALVRQAGSHASRITRNQSRPDKDQPPVPKATQTVQKPAPQNNRGVHHTPPRPPSRSTTLDNAEHPKKLAPPPPSQREEELMQQIKDLNRDLQEKGREVEILSNQCYFYQSEPYRQEVLSIRTHLQVNDPQEPWQISQKFGDITKQVENISRNLGEFLASSYKAIASPRATHFSPVLRRCMTHPDHPVAEAPIDVEPEDFIDFGCRALINDCLMKMLNPEVFHPALSSEQNLLLVDLYKKIRKQDPQIISGRWRVSAFKSYENLPYPPKDQTANICQIIFLLCTHIYEPEACTKAIERISSEVENLAKDAWSWNVLAKTSMVTLDFHPYHVLPGEAYSPDMVNLEGGRKSKPPASGSILATTRLGLMSSEAPGRSMEPVYSYQLKATVLAKEYFDSNH